MSNNFWKIWIQFREARLSQTNGRIPTIASSSHYLSYWRSASTATATEHPALSETLMASTSTSQTTTAKARLLSAVKVLSPSWELFRSAAASPLTQTCCRCTNSPARCRHGRLTPGARSCHFTTATGCISTKARIETSMARLCSSHRRRHHGRPRANTMRVNYLIGNTTCTKRIKMVTIIVRLGDARNRGRAGPRGLSGLRQPERERERIFKNIWAGSPW